MNFLHTSLRQLTRQAVNLFEIKKKKFALITGLYNSTIKRSVLSNWLLIKYLLSLKKICARASIISLNTEYF